MTESAPKKDQKKKDAKQEEDLVTVFLSRVFKIENSKKKSMGTVRDSSKMKCPLWVNSRILFDLLQLH